VNIFNFQAAVINFRQMIKNIFIICRESIILLGNKKPLRQGSGRLWRKKWLARASSNNNNFRKFTHLCVVNIN
jgi:Na+/citrate or Na+/malate symporter